MSKVSHVTVGFVVYQYTYCLNNPLIYTDPSGYIRVPAPYPADSPDHNCSIKSYVGYKPWEAVYARMDATWGPQSWSYNWETGEYENSWTGEEINPKTENSDPVEYLDMTKSLEVNTRYAIIETAYLWNGVFHGNGNFGIVRLGPAISATGRFPTFGAKTDADIFKGFLDNSNTVRSLFSEGVSLEGVWNVLKKTSVFPVAYSIEANGSSSAGVASSASIIGGVIALRGNDKFKASAFTSGGIGIGSLSVSAEAIIMRYFYAGNINNFNLSNFIGYSLDIHLAGGEGFIGSAMLSIIPTSMDFSGDYIIGLGGGIGGGTAGTWPVSVAGTIQYTELIRK
ncbi:MAG: hypothetical protein GF364_04070 [Candidatus Lokiarchaeota archaeon]|nr:hypothetical protein [Candidatus Lokiarchaeota archaeon]